MMRRQNICDRIVLGVYVYMYTEIHFGPWDESLQKFILFRMFSTLRRLSVLLLVLSSTIVSKTGPDLEPYLSHIDNFNFRCPAPKLNADGEPVPSIMLPKQIKLGVNANFERFKLLTQDHYVQLCYHHGSIAKDEVPPFFLHKDW
jgi:hypothetical protein